LQITLWGEGAADSEVLIDNLRFTQDTLVMDVNGDVAVNLIDFAKLQAFWMVEDCGAVAGCQGADLDESGSVDATDLLLLGTNWLWQKGP